jgi:hypothetical protein
MLTLKIIQEGIPLCNGWSIRKKKPGWEKGVKDEVRNEKSEIGKVGKDMLQMRTKGQLKEIVFS